MTSPERLLELISPARRDVLVALRQHGEAWAAALAEELHLSVSALRQSLTTLEAEGLVTSRQVRSGPGRPRMYYRLTPAAESLFYQRRGLIFQMFSAALELVASDRPVTFASWGEQGARLTVEMLDAQSQTSASADHIELLESSFRYAGYHPEIIASPDAVNLVLHNCPVLDLAQERPALCELERRYTESLAGGVDAVRKEYRLEGAPICVYQLLPLAEGMSVRRS